MAVEHERVSVSLSSPSWPTSTLADRVHSSPLIDFKERLSALGSHELYRSRSNILVKSKVTKQSSGKDKRIATAWDIKPLDLSAKLYSAGCLMAKHPQLKQTDTRVNLKETRVRGDVPHLNLPELLKTKTKEENDFNLNFRTLSPFGARIESVKFKTISKGLYTPPVPHHFRGDIHRPLEDIRERGLSEFTTFREKDPMKLKFRNEMLEMTIPELSSSKQVVVRDCTAGKIPKLGQEPKWNKDLYLTKSVYKKGRSAKSAFYQRIQEKLDAVSSKKIHSLSEHRPDIRDNKTVDWIAIMSRSDLKLADSSEIFNR